jgi:cyclopropane fatty-acyl-phospholipid synthase-like methyltransferase
MNKRRVEGAIYRKRLEIVLRWVNKLSLSVGANVPEIGCGVGGSCTVALGQCGYLVEAMILYEGC